MGQLVAALVDGPSSADLLTLVDDSITVRFTAAPLLIVQAITYDDRTGALSTPSALARLTASGLVASFALGSWQGLTRGADRLGMFIQARAR